MGQDSVTGILFATFVEAKPFILNLALKEMERDPFPVFANGSLQLIVSGIGKVNAAMACTHLIMKYGPGRILNDRMFACRRRPAHSAGRSERIHRVLHKLDGELIHPRISFIIERMLGIRLVAVAQQLQQLPELTALADCIEIVLPMGLICENQMGIE